MRIATYDIEGAPYTHEKSDKLIEKRRTIWQ